MSALTLKNRHLIIDHTLAAEYFAGEPFVNVVYTPDRGELLVAPGSDVGFKKRHKTSAHMLKDKNLKGDKAVSFEELLIDNDLDDTDRELPYRIDQEAGAVVVQLN